MNLLLFSLCWMLLIRLNYTSEQTDPIPLSMAEQSVDDMYEGCREKMNETVETKFFNEKNTAQFADVWKNAETCANDKLNPEDQALTKNHMQAICAYTANYKMFYKTFNDAVRTRRSKYGSGFPFHSLHFWLTSAVQILNKNENCRTTYRRNDVEFTGGVDNFIRFGNFASSSYKSNLTMFGNKTCFEITTCLGAYLKHYPAITGEEEVLIPPYEVFKITDKKAGSAVEELKDCEVVYILESAGVRSNLNCKLVIYKEPVSSSNGLVQSENISSSITVITVDLCIFAVVLRISALSSV